MGRKRKDQVLSAAFDVVTIILSLFFKVVVFTFTMLGTALSLLFGLFTKQLLQRKRATRGGWRGATNHKGTGQAIYRALKKEDNGPTGKTVKRYFLESCEQMGMTAFLPLETLDYIRSEQRKGMRPEGIAKNLLRRFPAYDKKELEGKVRTVTSIASIARTRVQAEELGLEWYCWETCHDIRVRQSHRNMQGVLVSWNDPPSPEELIGEPSCGKYHAGQGEECRCDAYPVMHLDDVQWPARVCTRGRIVTMSRRGFQKLSGME